MVPYGRSSQQRWANTIDNHRGEIEGVLKQMPSLRPQIDEYVAHNYPNAVRFAARDTHRPPPAFPQENPYTVEQTLDVDFFPGENDKAVDP
ncbi:DUF29 family protein [Duganella sp. FT94W]|uniref:DUF29 family protein n=1 Tax=Duganella lactea TaxID=2692173 RepID=A0ABW9V6P3_9BURK|nr:DUF29 family protein [Duganella lactea]